jgi:hypothetical protein
MYGSLKGNIKGSTLSAVSIFHIPKPKYNVDRF